MEGWGFTMEILDGFVINFYVISCLGDVCQQKVVWQEVPGC